MGLVISNKTLQGYTLFRLFSTKSLVVRSLKLDCVVYVFFLRTSQCALHQSQRGMCTLM